MTESLSYTLALHLAVQEPARVLEAAARKIFRRRGASSVVAARALLAGDVPKALTVLIELHDLASAGAVVLQIQSGSGEPIPAILPQPGA